ncbi:hypothetical protein DL769_010149 [Monosporascus sp. CRB-8-3]|nr:hypothetical protein DL769_010149 [Monosporascus sp. CRB-8-3]
MDNSGNHRPATQRGRFPRFRSSPGNCRIKYGSYRYPLVDAAHVTSPAFPHQLRPCPPSHRPGAPPRPSRLAFDAPPAAVRRVPAPAVPRGFFSWCLTECENSRGNVGRNDVTTTGSDNYSDDGNDANDGFWSPGRQAAAGNPGPHPRELSERDARDPGPEPDLGVSYAEPPLNAP